jgi:hypothetical protein
LVHFDSCGVSDDYLKQFHGKAITLDIEDIQAPLPLLFLSHEYRVRGRNIYQPKPDVEVSSDWQVWMVTRGVVNKNNNGSFMFSHEALTSSSGPPAGQSLPQVASTFGSQTQTVIKPPTADLVEKLMACQHAMPSWKVGQREDMGWEGTAEEAPTSSSSPPAGQSLPQVASTSRPQIVIKPLTADLVEELMACQRAMPGWKA